MRVVVDSWDDDFIMATDSESGLEQKIYYRKTDNRYALGDHGYLKDMLQKGDQLNIVMPRIENDIIYPAIVIYNPDYLFPIICRHTHIAGKASGCQFFGENSPLTGSSED